jgi:hypothetical protein
LTPAKTHAEEIVELQMEAEAMHVRLANHASSYDMH